jgi:hypothetical protein
MASCVRNDNDPTHGPLHDDFGRAEEGEDDWQSIPTRHRTNWGSVQPELDLRKLDIFVFERLIHSNDQGKLRFAYKLAYCSY